MSRLYLIHGFWSSPSTWDGLVGNLEADRELSYLSVERFGYPSPKVRAPLLPSRIPDYDDVAQAFYSTLQNDPNREIGVVTHSQGGLILQRFLSWMLEEGKGRDLSRIKLIVMLACPNEGSEYLRSMRKMLGFGRHPQARELSTLNKHAMDSRRVILRQIINVKEITERTCPIPIYVFAGQSDKVVLRASAQGTFPTVGVLPGDHFSIIDPNGIGNITTGTLKRLLLRHLGDRPVDSFLKHLRDLHDAAGSPPIDDLVNLMGGGPVERDFLERLLTRESGTLPPWAFVARLLNACEQYPKLLAMDVPSLGSAEAWRSRHEAALRGLVLPSPLVKNLSETIQAPKRPAGDSLSTGELQGVIDAMVRDEATAGGAQQQDPDTAGLSLKAIQNSRRIAAISEGPASTPVMGLQFLRETFEITTPSTGVLLLIVVDSSVGPTERWLTDETDFVAGRDKTCELVLDDLSVSRRHVQIRRLGDFLWCTDLGTTNGSFVNENMLKPGIPKKLGIGDKLVVGPYTLLPLSIGDRHASGEELP